MKNQRVLIIVVYATIATLLSFPFRLFSPDWLDLFRLPYGSFYGMSMLVGVGPIVAAFICSFLFRNKKIMLGLWGNSVTKSLLFLAVPIAAVVYLGVSNKEEIDTHLFALKVSGMWLLYIIGEEFGWRGYLQQLISWNDYAKSVVIGIIWYLWHLSFLYGPYSLQKEFVFILVLLVGSFLALKVTKRTKSLVSAIALHFSFSVLTNISLPANSYIPIGAMCFCWLLLYLFWNKRGWTFSRHI